MLLGTTYLLEPRCLEAALQAQGIREIHEPPLAVLSLRCAAGVGGNYSVRKSFDEGILTALNSLAVVGTLLDSEPSIWRLTPAAIQIPLNK